MDNWLNPNIVNDFLQLTGVCKGHIVRRSVRSRLAKITLIAEPERLATITSQATRAAGKDHTSISGAPSAARRLARRRLSTGTAAASSFSGRTSHLAGEGEGGYRRPGRPGGFGIRARGRTTSGDAAALLRVWARAGEGHPWRRTTGSAPRVECLARDTELCRQGGQRLHTSVPRTRRAGPAWMARRQDQDVVRHRRPRQAGARVVWRACPERDARTGPRWLRRWEGRPLREGCRRGGGPSGGRRHGSIRSAWHPPVARCNNPSSTSQGQTSCRDRGSVVQASKQACSHLRGAGE